MKGDATIDMDRDAGILFTEIHYPAGEIQVRLTEAGIALVKGVVNILIISRRPWPLAMMSLLLLKSAVDGVSELGKNVMLFLPYLPYGRADRRFVEGDCAGLDTYMEMLLGVFEAVYTVDAHPGASNPWLLHGSIENIPASGPINKAIGYHAFNTGVSRLNVVFPDAGARLRYATTVSPDHGIIANIVHCEKKRNPETGKFEGFVVPVDQMDSRVPSIIVDDICDGGGTFVGIGQILQDAGFSNMALYVTHGIFSKGFGELVKYFGQIYTTDTFMDSAPYPFVKVLPVIEEESRNIIEGKYDA